MTEFYEQPLPIRTYDIDFAGIVSNIVFIRWLEDLRLGLLDQAYPLIQALAEDVAPILLATRISYRKPVTIADPLLFPSNREFCRFPPAQPPLALELNTRQ